MAHSLPGVAFVGYMTVILGGLAAGIVAALLVDFLRYP